MTLQEALKTFFQYTLEVRNHRDQQGQELDSTRIVFKTYFLVLMSVIACATYNLWIPSLQSLPFVLYQSLSYGLIALSWTTGPLVLGTLIVGSITAYYYQNHPDSIRLMLKELGFTIKILKDKAPFNLEMLAKTILSIMRDLKKGYHDIAGLIQGEARDLEETISEKFHERYWLEILLLSGICLIGFSSFILITSALLPLMWHASSLLIAINAQLLSQALSVTALNLGLYVAGFFGVSNLLANLRLSIQHQYPDAVMTYKQNSLSTILWYFSVRSYFKMLVFPLSWMGALSGLSNKIQEASQNIICEYKSIYNKLSLAFLSEILAIPVFEVMTYINAAYYYCSDNFFDEKHNTVPVYNSVGNQSYLLTQEEDMDDAQEVEIDNKFNSEIQPGMAQKAFLFFAKPIVENVLNPILEGANMRQAGISPDEFRL